MRSIQIIANKTVDNKLVRVGTRNGPEFQAGDITFSKEALEFGDNPFDAAELRALLNGAIAVRIQSLIRGADGITSELVTAALVADEFTQDEAKKMVVKAVQKGKLKKLADAYGIKARS